MKIFTLFLQIGDLFAGRFNWRGLFHLFLFLAMAAVIVGFTGFAGYKTFQRKKKDDV